MKKRLLLLVSISFISLISCGQSNKNSDISSSSISSSESITSSSSISSISSISSEEKSSSKSSVSSSKSSSSSKASSSKTSSTQTTSLQLKNNNGMVVDFAVKGAKINKITYEGKAIGQNGFIAGRVANRIAGGSFTLNGTTYNINKNEGNNTLHGGSKGFGEVDWSVKESGDNFITFEYNSPDGDMGFPGAMNVTTKYTLTDAGELIYEITGKSDKDTIFNPINHLYMNLNGSTNVSDHKLWIDGDKYLSSDSSKLPTGEIKDVSNRPSMNYTTMKNYEKGNDRCLVLNGEGYRKVAELQGISSGIKMELYTDRVALQLYDDGQRMCLEAQDYIDAIHHDNFPSIVLNANETWYSKSAYCFSKVS